jgi:hypothetical protein
MNRHYVAEDHKLQKFSGNVGDEAGLGKSTAESIYGKDLGCTQGCTGEVCERGSGDVCFSLGLYFHFEREMDYLTSTRAQEKIGKYL